MSGIAVDGCLWAYSNDRTVLTSIQTLAWTDANISDFINSL